MNNSSYDLIPHIVINPSSIVSYSEVVWNKPHSRNSSKFIDTDKDIDEQSTFLNSTRKANGHVSVQARRKLSKAIEYLITTSHEKKVLERLSGKYVILRAAFITLTLPSQQIHEDKVIINKCLNQFLIEICRYHGVSKYVWRAEKQKNGNIHFHIVTDNFIPYYENRNRWNRIVNKLGYVDRFQEKHGHTTPNSTDIHSTKKIKNLKAYLVKYMTKDVDKQSEDQSINNSNNDNSTTDNDYLKNQTGRIWGCSQNLSQTRGLNLIADSEINDELKKVFSSKKVHKYESTYFTVYYVNYQEFRNVQADILFKYFSNYLFEQLNFSEQLKISA